MDTPTGRSASFAAHASLLVVIATFIALLGGLHPSNHDRDVAVTGAAVLFAALNLPSVLVMARSRSGRTAAILLLLARVAFAVVTLRFVQGISHEGRARRPGFTTPGDRAECAPCGPSGFLSYSLPRPARRR